MTRRRITSGASGVPERWQVVVAVGVAALVALGLAASAGAASAKALGGNGQIAFAREATPAIPDQGHITYRINPNGTGLQQLAEPADFPKWSPDGSELTLGDLDCQFAATCAAVILNPDTGSVRTLPNPAPGVFNEWFGCGSWSPDGARLACSAISDTPGATGVYTLRSSDGGGLVKVLSCDDCGPADYSPDGKQLVLEGTDDNGDTQLFVVKLNGSGLQKITPSGTSVDGDSGASWSPTGNSILFAGHPDPQHRRAVFVVNSDGSGLHQLPIPGCGGAFPDPSSVACFGPGWSPDGTQLVFARASAMTNVQNIYTANADGSHVRQVTHESSGLGVTTPDWGSHPYTR